MRIYSYIAALAGLAAATALVLWQGAGPIAASLAAAGWAMLWLGPLYLPVVLMDALGWRCLVPRSVARPVGTLLRATWIGLGVNWLLPVAQIGGELVKARLIMQRGVAGGIAGASVVADKTVQALTQVIFTLVGIAALAGLESDTDIIPVIVFVTIGFTALIYLFYRVQRRGLFNFLASGAARLLRGGFDLDLRDGARAIDGAIRDTYKRRGALLAAILWRLGGRVFGVVEMWIALYLLGHPPSLLEALMLESLGQAVRSLAFAIPGALGVQEGGYLVLGQLVGLGPDVSLALALMKRVRELMVGVPALLVWQAGEGRLLWRRRLAR